jgi:hypothetical protein
VKHELAPGTQFMVEITVMNPDGTLTKLATQRAVAERLDIDLQPEGETFYVDDLAVKRTERMILKIDIEGTMIPKEPNRPLMTVEKVTL